MSEFMRVHGNFGQEYVINVDNISWINVSTGEVCMTGVNHGNGILRILPGDIQRLLVMTVVAENDTD